MGRDDRGLVASHHDSGEAPESASYGPPPPSLTRVLGATLHGLTVASARAP